MLILIFSSIFFPICLTETLNLTEDVKRYLFDYGSRQAEDDSSLKLTNETVLSNALLFFRNITNYPLMEH